MARDLGTILKLRVPIIVRLGHRTMALNDVLSLAPGSIIELPQNAETPLDLMVSNVEIGEGAAVKIGENFGVRISKIGPPEERVQAIAGGEVARMVETQIA